MMSDRAHFEVHKGKGFNSEAPRKKKNKKKVLIAVLVKKGSVRIRVKLFCF